jgi:alpha-mannosidase
VEKDGIHFGFAFNLPDSKTRVDIPWGIMEVEKDQWPQANRNWLAMQRWLDISNTTQGVTWCSLDAPLFEYGDRYANIARGWGSDGNWITKLEPGSTVYSWAMNNHWHTNFPLTQDGPVQFRYRLFPHTGYDVVKANRFGLEQSQPLVYVMADKDPHVLPLIAIDNPKVYSTIIKSPEAAHTLIIRLRSLSDKGENVNLSFPKMNPTYIFICDKEEIAGKETDGNLVISPYGQVTLRLEY